MKSMPTLRAAALALLAAAPPVCALDLPPMKNGLWESKVSREGAAGKGPGTQMCLDAATRKEMVDMGIGAAKSMCTRSETRRDGNRIYGSAECKIGESTMKSNSVTTFSGDNAYRTEVKAAYDPPFMGKTTSATVLEAKWTGPCPADMQPGDLVLPGGQKMNMRAMTGNAK